MRTSAIPAGLVDYHVPDVAWVYTDKQKEVLSALREAPGPLTVNELMEASGLTDRYIREVLVRFAEGGAVEKVGTGAGGAALWSISNDDVPSHGLVDIGLDATAGEESDGSVGEASA